MSYQNDSEIGEQYTCIQTEFGVYVPDFNKSNIVIDRERKPASKNISWKDSLQKTMKSVKKYGIPTVKHNPLGFNVVKVQNRDK